MDDKRFEVLTAMKDHYAHLFSRVHYLFVAHGAGFVGGLTILKDYTSTPQYRGIGIPIAIFGIGLISAVASYGALSFAQMLAKNAVLDRKGQKPSELVFWLHYGGFGISVVALIAALGFIIFRVVGL